MLENMTETLKNKATGFVLYGTLSGILRLMPLPFNAVFLTNMLSYLFILYHDTETREKYKLNDNGNGVAILANIIILSVATYFSSFLSLTLNLLISLSLGVYILNKLTKQVETDQQQIATNDETEGFLNKLFKNAFESEKTNLNHNDANLLSYALLANVAVHVFSSFFSMPLITTVALSAFDYAKTMATIFTLSSIGTHYLDTSSDLINENYQKVIDQLNNAPKNAMEYLKGAMNPQRANDGGHEVDGRHLTSR